MRFIRGTIHQNAYFCNFTDNKTTSTLNVQFLLNMQNNRVKMRQQQTWQSWSVMAVRKP
jgi:hypothetical protein